ncbi:MAG: HTTM domain-containing protein [Polyangiaceae bacterium]
MSAPGTDAKFRAADLPWHAQFWLGKADPRPFALFRILLGLTVCHDLFNYARDLRAFLTDDGMLPRSVPSDPYAWGVFGLTGSFGPVAVLFGLGCCAVLAFTLGYRTRPAAAISWLFLTSLVSRNPYVTDGGDDLVRCLMFLCIFSDLSGCWSADVRLGRRAPHAVSMLGPRFLQLHIALLYFCAARLKFRKGWLTQNVIFQCLQLTGFARPPGHLLMHSPLLCRLTTVTVLGFEFAFAFLAFSPVKRNLSRLFAVGVGAAVQVGILLTMRVGVFTEAMLSSMALFACPEWFDYVAKKANLSLGTNWSSLLEQPQKTWQDLRAALGQGLVLALLLCNFVRLAWGPFMGSHIHQPRWFSDSGRWLWLDQPFGLFDVVYPIPRWYAPGTTAAGTHVDTLAAAVPDLVPAVRWRFSRWYKFTFKERERPFHFPELSSFICRAYAENTGTRLREFTLFEELTPPRLPGGAVPVPETRERWHQVCVE